MFARTVSHGNSAASWNMRATRPRRSIVPAEGVSRPAMRLSRVLLPQPDAPTRQSSSPACDLEGDPVEGVHRRRRPGRTPSTGRGTCSAGQGRRRHGRGRRRRSSETLDLVVAAVGEDLVEEREVVDAVEVDGLEEADVLRVLGRLAPATRRSGRG